MKRAQLIAVAISVTALVLTGCSSHREPAPAGPRFPSRPAPIALDRVDPCSLLDPVQRQRLDLPDGKATRPTVNGAPGVGCVWASLLGTDYAAQTIRIGADVAASDPAGTVIEVAGFGAVRDPVRDPMTGGASVCQVTVDAAPDGSIRVLALNDREPRPSDDEMCRLATEATEMIMASAVRAPR